MSFTIIIPARYASSRLPGKPLLSIGDKPMIEHVYQRASLTSALNVIVATDDERIYQAVKKFGGNVVMTREDHPSGTDRLQEVAEAYQLDNDHIVVNVQGDEPFIPSEAIEQVVKNLQLNDDCSISTLCEPIIESATIADINAVKVVRDHDNKALYFSRSLIPFVRQSGDLLETPVLAEDFLKKNSYDTTQWFKHIGLYAYRVSVLNQYIKWVPAPIEKLESLEQLRALYYGIRIHCAETNVSIPNGIDTEEDLNQARIFYSNAEKTF